MSRLDFCGQTDVGSHRETNEDSYLCLDLSSRSPAIQDSAALLVVADGIGGQAGGAVASRLAADTLKAFLLRSLTLEEPLPDWRSLLSAAIQEANARILEQNGADINLTGMGTTLVAALVVGGVAWVGNVGDSRAYHIRGARIDQVTRDHSWVAEQNRVRKVSEWELNRSPFRHMITRSLGFAPDVEADTFEVALAAGDYLLLCSDGLYSALPDPEIAKVFSRTRLPEKICRKLVDSANRAGGRDNITAVVARWGDAARPPKR